MMQNQVVLDTSFYDKLTKTGKFIIWRGDTRDRMYPHAEAYYPSRVYTDTDVIPGRKYFYKFKFVDGARDSDFSEVVEIQTPELPTPTPTCAIYRYDISHVAYHTGITEDLTGRYTIKSKSNTGHVNITNGYVNVMYYAPLEIWIVTTAESFLYFEPRLASAHIQNPHKTTFEQVFVGDNKIAEETYFAGPTEQGESFTFYNLRYRVSVRTSSGIAYQTRYSPRWNLKKKFTKNSTAKNIMTVNLKHPLPETTSGKWWKDFNSIEYRVNCVSDINLLPTNRVEGLLMTRNILFINKATTKQPPNFGWELGSFWKKQSKHKDSTYMLKCFELTPTPTPTFTPTPTPSPTFTPTPTPTYSPTPTPTPTITMSVTYTPTPTPTECIVVLDYCEQYPIFTEQFGPIMSEKGETLIIE